MRIFFIVCAVLGTIGAIGLFVMLLGFRVKVNLGFTLPKGKTIPIEKLIPRNAGESYRLTFSATRL